MTRLPPGPRLPRLLQHLMLVASRRHVMRAFRRRYGPAFTIRPLTGPAVVLSDPALVRQLFLTSSDVVGNAELNLGRVFGPASLLGLEGERHHQHRKLLAPPFYGQRMMRDYEAIVEEETRREAASWPEGKPVGILPPMTRITLNVMLRAIFGSDGPELDALRVLGPRLTSLGTRLFLLPLPRTDLGRLTPWGRFNAYRREFDAVVETMITRAQADPAFAERQDVLSIMLRARYDDGEPMTHGEIADEVLTLLVAGHETTAGTLAWAIERIRRHPSILARLVAEADAGGAALRRTTILEVQRIRPVVDLAGRQVLAESVRLGDWEIPRGHTILVGIHLMHSDDSVFADAGTFNPDRFAGVRPDRYAWVPFGGGYRRCIGAAFAEMEMDIVLRTLLRDFWLGTTAERGERWHSRGVSFVPASGGRVVVRRRTVPVPVSVPAPVPVPAPVVAAAPGRVPLLGHGLPLLRRPLPYLASLRDQGDVVRIHLGRQPAYLVTRSDLAWRVLMGEAGTFTRDNVSPAVGVLFGAAVATLGGPAHRDRRRLLAPSFHRKRIAEYARVMTRVADEHTGQWRDGQRLDVTTAAFDLSLATLSATLFNSPIGAEAVAEIHRSLPPALDQIPRRVLTPAPLLRLPIPANRRFEAAAARLRAVFRQVIDHYRAEGADRGDLLSALLSGRDEDFATALTDQQVEDELVGFLVAGVDTPATTVAWVLHELGRDQEIERRLHAEVDEVTGDGPITPEHVHALTYTRQVIQEALRHYAAWINLLEASSPVDLGGGARFPAGTTIALSPYLVHHDPRLFSDPGRFDPDRWSPDRARDIAKDASIPFGAGVRRCPGDFYALTEMTIQIATIARRWRLEPAPGAVVRPATRSVVVYPDGLSMIVRSRREGRAAAGGRPGSSLGSGSGSGFGSGFGQVSADPYGEVA